MSNEFRSRLIKEDLYYINLKKYVEKMKNKTNIIIWGSAPTGQFVYDFFDEFGFSGNVNFFADNKREKWGTEQNGLLVLPPDEVVKQVKRKPDTIIIIAALHLVDIKKQLLSLGIQDNSIDLQGFSLAKDFWTFREDSPYHFINSNMDQFEKVYSYLEDDHSKAVYLGVLNSKISLDNRYLIGIDSSPEEQYFDNELIKLQDTEVFCDCGSYIGDTLETFMMLSKENYKKYIAIEADKEIFSYLSVLQ